MENIGKSPIRSCKDFEITDNVIEYFDEKWFTSYQYTKENLKPFRGDNLSKLIKIHPGFIASMAYVGQLAERLINHDLKGIDSVVMKELNHWDDKGGYCIYISILHYCLIRELVPIDADRVKFIQGYYKHPVQGLFKRFIPESMNQAGLHAYLTIDNAVVDFSIIQEAVCFDFPDGAYILGKVPELMELYGWEESHETVLKYAREIGMGSGMTYKEWITFHKIKAIDFAKFELQNYIKNYDR